LFYMVMEFLHGETIQMRLQKFGSMRLEVALPILEDVAHALDYAHAQGIVHRDIKPANIMLQHGKTATSGGDMTREHAVLMDFGIAKMMGSAMLTQTAGTMGTLDYIAPEQIMSASEVDHRADIYALGVMTYQMLTSQLPFAGISAGQVLFAHLQRPAPDPRTVKPTISEAVAQVVMRAMAKKPHQRYDSAGEFVTRLRDANLALPLSHPQTESDIPTP
jgi:eukaryotic-like serine/threonine-protein kinase